MRIGSEGKLVIVGILTGERSHKDLKIAFDWEDTREGHKFWSKVRNGPGLTTEARVILSNAIGYSPEGGFNY